MDDDHLKRTPDDYRRMLEIGLDARYHGYIGIGSGGGKLSEWGGLRATRRLLERVRKGPS